MKLKEGISHALNGNAILFTGSGFSKGATNIQDTDFLTGRELVEFLKQKMGIVEQIGLGLASEMFMKREGADKLIDILHKQYTVKEISDHHRIIGSVNWRRVYSTNYDNVIETAYAMNSRKLIPVTLPQSPTQLSGKANICVHINGYIDQLTRESLSDSFKLTDTSYLTETFNKSDWAYFFRADLRQSQAIFFLGYSLFDIDITRVLYEEPDLMGKCFFITEPNPSLATTFTLEKYGRVISEGIENFSKYVDERKSSWNPAKNESVYVAFEKIQAPKDYPEIKDQDVFNLFLYGRENASLIYKCLLTPDKDKYYIRRSKQDLIFDEIKKGGKTFLITSSLGNGKTLFCLGISFEAVIKGYKVFLCKDASGYLESEINTICQIDEPVVVIFENYHRYLDQLRYLHLNRPQNLILILTCRSETNDIYYENLEDRGILPKLINIDRIDKGAATQIIKVFDHYGLWGPIAAKSDISKMDYLHKLDDSFQRLLLELLKSPDIVSRFTELLQGLNKISGATEVIVVACALANIGHEPRLSTISELLEMNVAGSVRFRRDPIVREIVDVRQDTVGIKSAIFGNFLLSNIPDSKLVIDTIIRIAKKAEALGRIDTTYQFLFRDMIRFRNVQSILPEQQRRPAIVNFYEALKNLNSTKNNPQFWLQYAIARLSFPDLDEAKIYFDTSYSFAKSRATYDTTQIDNHYARYLLERAKREDNANVAFEYYSEANALLSKQLLRPNRHYPYRVAIGYYDFFLSHSGRLDGAQKQTFRASCQAVLARIEKLSPEIRSHKYVRECREKLEEIVRLTIVVARPQ